MNSGVCVFSHPMMEVQKMIFMACWMKIKIEYPGPLMQVVLFKCLWFDLVKGMNVLGLNKSQKEIYEI